MNRTRRLKQRNINGTHSLKQWEALKKAYNYTCLCCHKQEPEIILTRDHIISLQLGGTDDIENIQPLCGQCNSSKWKYCMDYRNKQQHSEIIKHIKTIPVGLKLTSEQINEIRQLYTSGQFTQMELGKQFKVSQGYIGQIVKGKVRTKG